MHGDKRSSRVSRARWGVCVCVLRVFGRLPGAPDSYLRVSRPCTNYLKVSFPQPLKGDFGSSTSLIQPSCAPHSQCPYVDGRLSFLDPPIKLMDERGC